MEILIKIISYSLIIALIASPVIILIGLKRFKIEKHKVLFYLTIGLFITSIIMLTLGWWLDYSNEILLSHYGFDFDAINDTEKYSKVSAENLEKVKSLEISMMGIGWPLKAIITFSLYSPYLFLIYLAALLIQKNSRGKSIAETQTKTI